MAEYNNEENSFQGNNLEPNRFEIAPEKQVNPYEQYGNPNQEKEAPTTQRPGGGSLNLHKFASNLGVGSSGLGFKNARFSSGNTREKADKMVKGILEHFKGERRENPSRSEMVKMADKLYHSSSKNPSDQEAYKAVIKEIENN